MIGMHEVRFPEDVSWGSSGGPVYKTQVFTSHRGYEKRNVDWSQPMMQFNVAYGVKTDTQILNVLNFFNARQGRLFGFRYKNWCNYKIENGPIATGDGTSKRLPLWKFYGFSSARHYKRLRKIVRGSVRGVQVGFEPVMEGIDFRIDYDSGEIVFNSPVGYAIPVYAQNLEFDEPVQFEEDSVANVIDQFNNNSLSSLSLISVRGTFTAGSAFSPDLTETGTADSLYGRVYLLLNLDGQDGDTTTNDQSTIQNAVTLHGSASLSSDGFRHGNTSLKAGPNGYLSTLGSPYNFRDKPFTVELFAQRPLDGEAVQPLVGRWETATSQQSWLLRYNLGTERLEFLASTNGTNTRVILSHPWETSDGYFDHVAVDRLSSGWYVLRINGKVKQTSRDAQALFAATSSLVVGGVSAPQQNEGPFQGLIDSVRITSGAARHDGFGDVDIPAPYGVI